MCGKHQIIKDMNDEIFITIASIQRYKGRFPFSAGRQLIGTKEPNNKYDKKAIKIIDVGNTTVGYVANQEYTRLEGTQMADDVYDRIGEFCVVEVVKSTPTAVICKIVNSNFQKYKLIDFFTTDRTDGEYPFDEQYPFEFHLNDIVDSEVDFIPEDMLEYLICFDLGVESEQFYEIEHLFEDEDYYGRYCFDTYSVLENIKEKDKKHIEDILIKEADCEDCYIDLEEISQLAERICQILNR